MMIEGAGGSSPQSRWPRRLLIIGTISLIVGMAGLATNLSKINETLRPDYLNKAIIEPRETIEINLTGLRVYELFQNVTDTDDIDGSITIISNGVEVELREPSIMSGVGVMKFDEGVVFKPMGWIQLSENSRTEFTSESNLTIYLVDQNEVSAEAFTQPLVITSCLSLLLGGCLLPVSLVLFLIRRKAIPPISNVTLRTADGREVKLTVDTPTSSGAVLTTDQIYAIAKLQERAGSEDKITLDFRMVPNSNVQSIPPPFVDRPDVEEPPESSPIEAPSQPILEIKTEKQDTPEEKEWKEWDEG